MTAEKKKITLFAVIYIITAIALIFGIYAVYNLIAVEKPWTVGTTYLNKLDLTENKTPIFSVNVSSNKNKNGEKITELMLSEYNDINGTSSSSYGIQCIGDWNYINDAGYTNITNATTFNEIIQDFQRFEQKNKNAKYNEYNQTRIFGDFYFYKTDDAGQTFYKINYTDIPNELMININNKFYNIRLKKYSYKITNYHFLDIAHLFGKEETKTSIFTWFEVFDKIMNSAQNPTGEIEYSKFGFNAFNLAEFVEITYQDENGQYKPLEETDETKVLCSIPVDYTMNGATEIKDSMFNSVKNTTTWSYWNNTTAVDFWGAEINQKVTEKQLNYIHYSAYNGYFLTIDKKYSNYLKTLNNVDVVIDLTNKNQYELMGIDLQNFDFKINSLTIKNATKNFLLLNTEKCSVTPVVLVEV